MLSCTSYEVVQYTTNYVNVCLTPTCVDTSSHFEI